MQQRFLIRARSLAAFRRAIVDGALLGDPLAARRRAVIVPTRASAEVLRQTIETSALGEGGGAVLLPDLVTRDDWIGRLHGALSDAPGLLTRVERELLLERAAARVAARTRMPGGPFQLRPGLVAAMLDLYDELQRRQRTVRRFASALFDQLRVERGTDRGSESLIHQTSFLGFTFLGYERGVARSGRLDEHRLRRRLLTDQPGLPFDHLIIAVADHPSDPRGLWPADFDLLGRLRGLARLDVIVTEETHDAGFRERIERELPGIEEAEPPADPAPGPVLVRAAGAPAETPCTVSRDREEELRDVARAMRARAARAQGQLREPVAVVFQRPLPYLYLAQQVFADARVPYQTFDALPLGVEPYAALLDLVLAFARTGGTREAAVALLRSRLLRLEVDGEAVDLADAAALDAVLAERRATGEATSYASEVAAHFGARTSRDGVDGARAARAARAAGALHDELQPVRSGAAASEQVGAISRFLRRAERPVREADPASDRHHRARAAVLGVLDGLADGLGRHDDHPREVDDLIALIHHAVEARTFTPRRGHAGAYLVDAMAARFGDFDHVHLVGLVETDWPERPRRSIFYTSGLLKSLGWPQESDQTRAQQAAFRDLLRLARRTTSLHAFQFEGDAIIARSPMIGAALDLPSEQAPPSARRRMFADEVLVLPAPQAGVGDGDAARWLALRLDRPALDAPAFGGRVGAQPARVYRVSRVDRYVDCPFKYFAESVLGLPEEREESAGLTPLERGTLVHELFERFYREWQQDRRGAITPATLPEALERFGGLVRAALKRLPEADRSLEEARLLGSIVARGLAERVFELEADAGGQVTTRLIEFKLDGPFVFPRLAGLAERRVAIRGKADRIDVFGDGSLRVIDYKLGRLPDTKTSLQVAVYATCARQALEAEDGRPHPVAAAMYLAFGDDRQFEGALGGSKTSAAAVVADRAGAFADTVDRIEAGDFGPRPRDPGLCQWCGYAGLCRKEYRLDPSGEEDDGTAEPV